MRPVSTLLFTVLLMCAFTNVADGLRVLVRPTEYYGTAYTRPPEGADYVYFEGSEILIEIEVTNHSEEQEVVVMPTLGIADGLRATLIADGAQFRQELAMSDSARVKFDEREVQTDIPASLSVPAKGSVVWTAQVAGSSAWVPGRYRLEVTPQLKSARGLPAIAHATQLRIEVRAISSEADRIEVLRRQATAAFVRRDYLESGRLLDDLLRAYPPAHLAYVVKGHIAKTLGRTEEAITYYRRALELLTSAQDVLFLKLAGSSEVRHSVDSLSVTLEQMLRK